MPVPQISRLPLAVSLSILAASVAAQKPSDGDDFRLDPIVVTSTLGSETADESLSSVTIIDSQTLERRQPNEFSDVLEGQAGINFVTNGGFGKESSVFTRGTGSESTILLIDGIRVRSATDGGAPWQFIPPQLFHGVEVVRGPRSSLYGADAAGGVVQAFTRPRDGSDSQWAEIGGGSFDTFRGGAGVSGQTGNTGYSFQSHVFETNGASISKGGEDKGFDNASGNISIDHEFDDGTRLQLLGFRAQGNTEFSSGDTDFRIQTLGALAEKEVVSDWVTKIELNEARDEQETRSTFNDSVFDTRTRTIRWENTIGKQGRKLIIGTEHRNDEVSSSRNFAEDSRYNRAVFGQYLVERGQTDLQLAARWDDNETFGDKLTGSAAMGMNLDRKHRVRLSYGTAFRAPTFNELYYPYTPYEDYPDYQGNPNLSPERSETAELGFRGRYQNSFWDLAIFQTYVDDLITNQAEDALLQPQNVERARIQGFELTSGFHWDRWEFQSAATLQDPKNQQTGERLARRTVRSLRLDADYMIQTVNVGATGIFEGDRLDNDGSTLAGYGKINLRMNWRFAQDWSAGIRIDNVLDKDYETAGGYKNPGSSAFLTIRYGAR